MTRRPQTEFTPLPQSAPRSCGSCGARTTPTRCGWTGGRVAATPFEAVSQGTGELLVRHASCLPPETLYQGPLLAGEVIAVAGEGALEVLPRLSQKGRVRRGPAC